MSQFWFYGKAITELKSVQSVVFEMRTLGEYVKGLNPLKGKVVQTYYSSGARRRASELASKAESSYLFLKEFFEIDADLTLLVLSARAAPLYAK